MDAQKRKLRLTQHQRQVQFLGGLFSRCHDSGDNFAFLACEADGFLPPAESSHPSQFVVHHSPGHLSPPIFIFRFCPSTINPQFNRHPHK